MTTYYYSPAGLDTNDGLSVGSPRKTYQKALTSCNYGDSCIFAAGTYNVFGSGANVTPLITGSSANGPVLLQAESGASVIFDIPVAAAFRLFKISQEVTKIKFQDIQFTNSAANSIPLFDLQAECEIEISGKSIDMGGVAKNVFLYNALISNKRAVIECTNGCEIRNNITVPAALVNVPLAAGSQLTFSGTASRNLANLLRISTGMTNPENLVVTVDGHIGTRNVTSFATIDVAGLRLIITDNNLSCGGAGFSGQILNLATAALNYYQANPSMITITGNRSWSWGDRADTHRLIWCANDADWSPYDCETNWFLPPGFSEGDIATGDYINLAAFGAPTILPAGFGIGLMGDSIMNGVGSSDPDLYSAAAIASELTGKTLSPRDSFSFAGLKANALELIVDDFMRLAKPQYTFLSIGLNNINTTIPTTVTPATLAARILKIMAKIELWGSIPHWLGIGSLTGNPPDNTDVIATNDLIEAGCAANGWPYLSWLDGMQQKEPVNWETVFYDDLTTGLHPNDVGHYLIGEVAERLYNESVLGIRFGFRANFDGTIPTLEFPVSAPAKLQKVQVA